jgi:hypothetical protein
VEIISEATRGSQIIEWIPHVISIQNLQRGLM